MTEPSGLVVLQKMVPVRLARVKSAPVRLVPFRSAPSSPTPVRFAPSYEKTKAFLEVGWGEVEELTINFWGRASGVH